MKIGVVGCGAVGSYYGAKLARAGHEVHFLLRSDYQVVRRRGVKILSPQGDFHVQPKCAPNPSAIGPCELVLIALKSTANDQLPVLVPPLVSPSTAVLTLQNGLGNEESLARFLPASQIMGGLCFVGLYRVEPGVIRHLARGTIILGQFQRWPEPRTHVVAEIFRSAGVPCNVTDDLARTHWEKLVWNVPFNGLGLASAAGYDAVVRGEIPAGAALGPCLDTGQLLADPRWEALARELMLEVIAAARALGFQIPDSMATEQIEKTRPMAAYRASTQIDFERGQPLELDGMFFEPLRRAKSAAVATPRIEALCRIIGQLEARRTQLAL